VSSNSKSYSYLWTGLFIYLVSFYLSGKGGVNRGAGQVALNQNQYRANENFKLAYHHRAVCHWLADGLWLCGLYPWPLWRILDVSAIGLMAVPHD